MQLNKTSCCCCLFKYIRISKNLRTNIQVYYDTHPLGLFEFDFLIYPHGDLKEHIIIETKLSSKINDKEAAKNFAARHNCDTKTDKMTPGYWSCRLPKYASDLGLKGGGNYFW